MKTSRVDFQSLVEFAKNHANLREVISYASTSVYTELTIWPPQPPDLKDKNAEGLPSVEWYAWTEKNSKTISLLELGEVMKALDKIKKGNLTLADPKDNPMQYDRRFLQLQFDGNNITEVTPRSL